MDMRVPADTQAPPVPPPTPRANESLEDRLDRFRKLRDRVEGRTDTRILDEAIAKIERAVEAMWRR